MTARKLYPTEKQIELQIMQWLKWKGIWAFKIENGGVFDQKRGAYRFNHTIRTPGVSDIIGLLEDGTFLAIEVKSEKGRLSEHQEQFLANVRERGGLAIVARSVDDVEEVLA